MVEMANSAGIREVKPGWAPGVELRQTTVDCIQVVGDVRFPVSLRGVADGTLEWLRQLDGQRSWHAQLSEAQARGITATDARELLEQLLAVELLTDLCESGLPERFATPHVVGAPALVSRIDALVDGSRPCGPLPKPRDGDDWRLASEQLSDEIGNGPVIVALDAPWVDAAELEFVSMLIDRRVDHVVVGAGPTTVRIGPMTIDGGGPCVRCDELLRIDMDPSWKQLSVQLSLDEAPEQSPTLLALAAAEVARYVANAAPHGEAAAFNAVLKTGYRGGAWRRRPLARHLKCSCWWPQ